MRLLVRDILGQDQLAGATDGLAARSRVLSTMRLGSNDQVLFLDLSGISLATASFLREFVFGLRESVRIEWPDAHIVVANVSAAVEEELRLIARALGTAIAVCNLTVEGPSMPKIVGTLDPAQRRTLALLMELGESDAASLQARAVDETQQVGPTAWNNRLASLKERGLVIEERQDRRKIYRPILGGLSFGR